MKKIWIGCLLLVLSTTIMYAENGYELWLRYRPLSASLQQQYRQQIRSVFLSGTTPTDEAIRAEWIRATEGLFGKAIQIVTGNAMPWSVVYIDSIFNRRLLPPALQQELAGLPREGYLIRTVTQNKQQQILIAAPSSIGHLYATFHLLQLLQTGQAVQNLRIRAAPRVERRILNHWDNLDGTVERGYAGGSLWKWHTLPDYVDPRYIDYARANAAIGINGTVLTNVNANATALTYPYLLKVKRLADLFRPYGIRVYLTARFNAPVEMGGISTADPLDDEVRLWWIYKAREIYQLIPDFGGFLVKANSEGQPGPQDYGRTHAEGANMLAEALAPFGGIVMWRAFVYSANTPEDRHKQANQEFEPLDGAFHDNVMIQVKNGAIDFQPREPFHPLFGAMPKTGLIPEFQITQEYLGQATNWVYLAPLFKECLEADTHRPDSGNTVASIMERSFGRRGTTAIAGVANIGADINWTGHPMAQSNWYAFGRLAWDHRQSAEDIARSWIQLSFGTEPLLQNTMLPIMMNSREACVQYMTPLGLHHLMGTGHHYGPAPWVNDLGRADWTPVYYHRADSTGIGFDRTRTGSGALLQYAPYWQQQWGNPNSMDEKYLLWFHHLPWNFKLQSGKTLWDSLCLAYQDGVNKVVAMQQQWQTLEGHVDRTRFDQVSMLLSIQEKEARWWMEACLLYFQQYSRMPFPAEIAKPQKTLNYYMSLHFPYAPGH